MHAGKYEITVEGKEFPADMPAFLLLGKDVLAPKALLAEADALDAEADAEGYTEERQAELRAQAAEFRAAAFSMKEWQMRNPELTRLPD